MNSVRGVVRGRDGGFSIREGDEGVVDEPRGSGGGEGEGEDRGGM